MATDKAYKVLAMAKGLSNNKAKELIDRGLVYVEDKKVKIARAEIRTDTVFRIEYPEDIEILYEDEDIIAVNKPAQVDSYEIQDSIPGAELLHRLDRDTSGVLLLGKNREFIERAIQASKVHIEITTGRTHQIRVHLAHIGHPIVGDEQYGSRTQSKRILLHSAKMKLLGYEFTAAEPKDIARYK